MPEMSGVFLRRQERWRNDETVGLLHLSNSLDCVHQVVFMMRKVVLLGRFDSIGSLEIADPFSETSEDFHPCFQQVSRCCDVLAARLGVKSSEPAMSQVLPVNPKNL
jgi:protein-tyrosine-phosphatase